MSFSSYTSSERRGILAVAFVSLVIIGLGLFFSIKNDRPENIEEVGVVEMPELIDSVAKQKNKDLPSQRKGKQKASKPKKSKQKKTYRRRNPLDEPV